MEHPITISKLRAFKKEQRAKKSRKYFSCLTAYDASTARLVSQAGVHVVLVGDSLGMVMQGRKTTVPVSLRDMVYHTQCVRRGNQGSLLMVDMPFAQHYDSYKGVKSAAKLMQAGAQCVKIEGGAWLCDTVTEMARCGIPVCAHLGIRPQSVHVFGGYKNHDLKLSPKASKGSAVLGNGDWKKHEITKDAQALQKAGVVMLVLECVPHELSDYITNALDIPVIGIGSGQADGQVLVIQDLLGMTQNPPRFAPSFIGMDGSNNIQGAIETYHRQVINGKFPVIGKHTIP